MPTSPPTVHFALPAVLKAVVGRDRSTPVLVDQPGDRASGGGNIGHQVVGVAPAAGLRRRVLIFEP